MSKVAFVKQNKEETISRLRSLSSSQGSVTLWIKGQKDKKQFLVRDCNLQRLELLLDTYDQAFSSGTKVLCTFELRGQSYFSEVIFDLDLKTYVVLRFSSDLFASEKRSHFRLLTYPLYDISLEISVKSYSHEDVNNVLKLNSGPEKTNLFKSFIDLVKADDETDSDKFKFRIYNLSVSGLLLFVGKMELSLFEKDKVFNDVILHFQNEEIFIPQMRVVHVSEKVEKFLNDLGYKIGIQFENLSQEVDQMLGQKINSLLREVDDSKDFENFLT